MNIILGFGVTEQRFEDNLESKVRSHVFEKYSSRSDSYYTEAFVKEIRDWADALSKDSIATGEKFKNAIDHPDRYTYFWCTTISDPSHIVFILKFHHVNRRHAMSADGWGLMTSERVFCVHEWDASKARRDKAA
jgi:hypothetical protein